MIVNNLIGLNKIPGIFRDLDTVYHYCKAETASKLILLNKELRFSHRRESRDPIENVKQWVSFSDSSRGTSISTGDLKIVQQAILQKILLAKQICFCKNDDRINEDGIHLTPPFEYYGFLKPRMWDQYGDIYKGVCLAFSRSKLSRKETQSIKMDDVHYHRYSDLNGNLLSVNVEKFIEQGFYRFMDGYQHKILGVLLSKHKDYEGENEFRIISVSEEDEYLKIDDCLSGIIISSYTDEFLRWQLFQHAKEYNVKVLDIHWGSNGVSIYLT